MSKKKHKKKDSRPWRDNIEAVTVSIVVIVLFKYFILEAYKIPTGSMQPTLMGWDGGIYDRVLVDKFSYHYRDPLRWEVVVFKYPLNRAKNFIKRVVGMPSEHLEIRNGDIFVAPSESDPVVVLRRPRTVQQAQLKRLDSAGEWRVEGANWTAEGRTVTGEGQGAATFPRTSTSGVRDVYTDGYPGKMASKLKAAGKRSGQNKVGDLRLTGTVTADESCTEVRLEFREGSRAYTVHLPGPAAPDGARPAISLRDDAGEVSVTPVEGEPWRLRAGKRTRFLAQNLDDLVEVEVGDVELALEIPAASDQQSFVQVATAGGGADFGDLEVFRDIYYVTAGQKNVTFDTADDEYVMLGDNTQDSSDGRDWQLVRFELVDDEGRPEVVRGNDRGSENPVYVPGPLGTSMVFFDDELGERWIFPRNEARALEPERASYVPRDLIRGRAVLVVWPVVPRLDVYRIKWVR